MKLVFPEGEHGPVLLSPGVNRIGASPDGTVVLRAAGIRELHCEIHVTGAGANVQVPAHGGPVAVNGTAVSGLMALRPGDRIDIGGIVAAFAPPTPQRAATLPPAAVAQDADDDLGATRVRTAVPRFVLRGVSGAVAGALFPITGATVIGRAPECEITVQAEEISRRHALLKPVGDGLSVEDLDSSNGTWINGRRVQQGFLDPGDELRLDDLRFELIAPGVQVSRPTRAAPSTEAPAPRRVPAGRWAAILLTVALLAFAALALVPA